jgi:predicted ATPase
MLTDMLWPDAEAEVGRSRLRQTLSLLRAVLEPLGGPPVLHANRRSLRLVTDAIWCDAIEFEQAARRSDHANANGLYRGELLPGFYDEWVLEERARLETIAERMQAVRSPPTRAQSGAFGPTANDSAAVPSVTIPSAVPNPAASARLPSYLTRWVGTQDNLVRLRAQVIENRWVSVLGAGGCGKTRLTVEVARQFAQPSAATEAPRFERVFFASLVDCFNAPQTLDRLKLAVRLESAGDPAEQLVDALDGQPLLVVLDNCEQLEDDAVARLAWLSEQLPLAHWLASSRRPLGMNGEHEFVLQPLPLPSTENTLDEVVRNPAVALLLDRSRAHRPDFHVSAANRDSVVALVRWLEGLPLAIELAASRSRSLTPAHILSLLEAARQDLSAPAASLAWLSRRGNRSGNDTRHSSMLAVIEWSWKLLTPPLQCLLDAVCVLQAGASLEAACALLRATPPPDSAPAPSLASTHALLDELVAHSMLHAQAGADGQLRYRASEPVREYAASLRGADEARALRGHVLAWLLNWARAMPATPPLATVRAELPNLLGAFTCARDDGDAEAAVRLVLALQSSWGEIAIPSGLLDALSQLVEVAGLDPSLAAGGRAVAAASCFEAGRRDDAMRHALRALPDFAGQIAPTPAACEAAIPDPEIRAMVFSRVARIRWRIERDPVVMRALLAQGMVLARATGRRNTEATILSLEAHLAGVIDRDAERSLSLSRQALALWEQSGNLHLVHAGRFNVAVNLLQAKQYAQAVAGLLPLVDAGREQQDWDLLTGSLDACGTSLLGLRRWSQAEAHLRESLQVAWQTMEMQSVAFALWNISPVLARLRQGTLAAQTMGFAEVFWKQRFGEFDASDLRDLRRVRRFVRCLLGPQKAQAAWQEGAGRGLADAVRAVLER